MAPRMPSAPTTAIASRSCRSRRSWSARFMPACTYSRRRPRSRRPRRSWSSCDSLATRIVRSAPRCPRSAVAPVVAGRGGAMAASPAGPRAGRRSCQRARRPGDEEHEGVRVAQRGLAVPPSSHRRRLVQRRAGRRPPDQGPVDRLAHERVAATAAVTPDDDDERRDRERGSAREAGARPAKERLGTVDGPAAGASRRSVRAQRVAHAANRPERVAAAQRSSLSAGSGCRGRRRSSRRRARRPRPRRGSAGG